MDDLTQRALTQLNTATANHSDKQQREVEQQSLTEAPAFVTGFAGGKYLVERLGQEPTATGVAVTNGLLQTGRRVTTTGQFVDGVPRVKTVQPAVATVEAMGKIKYLYLVPTGAGQELWIGGWQPKPVLVTSFAGSDNGAGVRNTGGNDYFIDYVILTTGRNAAFISRTKSGVVYQYDFDAYARDSPSLFYIGYSFWARKTYGSAPGPGGTTIGSYWGKLFQGVLIQGIKGGGFVRQYLLPELVSPEAFLGDVPFYVPYAINEAGTHGIGWRVDYINPNRLAFFSAAEGIVDTGVDLGTLIGSASQTSFDCFDSNFSIYDASTFQADVTNKLEFTGKVSVYGFDGRLQTTKSLKIYGIPAAHRAAAILTGRPSYHP